MILQLFKSKTIKSFLPVWRYSSESWITAKQPSARSEVGICSLKPLQLNAVHLLDEIASLHSQ